MNDNATYAKLEALHDDLTNVKNELIAVTESLEEWMISLEKVLEDLE